MRSLPLLWDSLQMYLTFRAIACLHNDIHDYVDSMRQLYPDVFKEKRWQTLRDLPHCCTRFPGPNKTALFPLSMPMPLAESRFSEAAGARGGKSAGGETTAASFSFAVGRRLDEESSIIKNARQESRGIEGGVVLSGNIFSRSCWLRFTLSALDSRGMWTDDELERVADQGLGLRNVVRNVRASNSAPTASPWLDEHGLAGCSSFAAQEREALESRSRAAAPASVSTSQKRAKKRRECDIAGLDEAMSRPPKRGRGM